MPGCARRHGRGAAAWERQDETFNGTFRDEFLHLEWFRTMTSRMIQDAHMRPQLFHWNGRMTPESLHKWLRERGWDAAVPRDLFDMWQETGGGELFETETILGPLGDADLGDDIVVVNHVLHSRGMPERFLAYYVGTNVGAVDASTMEYVELDGIDFHPVRQFASLDDWYVGTLRAEYRERYGLR